MGDPTSGRPPGEPGFVRVDFTGEIWFWRGPAPWYFVTVPDDECRELTAASAKVSYGWGMIPATIGIGDTEWTTSLFPKDGRYLVPIKARVRDAERLDEGVVVAVRLTVELSG